MIDLRSDTVTRPTPQMLDVMKSAPVGDDVYGEDPSINQLETTVAALLGKEAALFVPSGTMANQIALNLHCAPGDSVIIEEKSHIFLYEAGAAAALSGVQFSMIPWSAGFSDAAITDAFYAESLHLPSTRLLAVENTHNRQFGRALASEELERIAARARSLKLKLHCDGARLWNAAVATGQSESSLSSPFDTVAVCFSKGLGAPVGSALVGPKELMSRARKIRKRWGGAMRQAGSLAAAAIYALEAHRPLLKRDHERAKEFASALRSGFGERLQLIEPTTNMVYFRVPELANLGERLQEKEIRISEIGGGYLRAVFHHQITDLDCQRVLEVLRDFLGVRRSLS